MTNERYTFPTVSEALPFICDRLLDIGLENGSRNGRVVEMLNPQVVIQQPWNREVLTIGRKANVYAQIAETMWVLAGRNDVEWLSAYLPRAKDFSDDGVVWRGGYGPRIRQWNYHNPSYTGNSPIDQIAHVVDLLKKDPLSRRAVVSIYDPRVDTEPGKDIPCNDFLQFQSRLGELHLTVTVRSNDVMWGWSGINAFEWSTLQEIVASLLGIGVGTLTFNIGSLHLYEQHWGKGRIMEYWEGSYRRIPFDPHRNLPTLADVDEEIARWFAWEDLCRNGKPVPDGLSRFKSPLIQAWAQAIACYWTGDKGWLESLSDTALWVAAARTPKSLLPTPSEPSSDSLGAVVGAGTGHGLSEPQRAFYGFVTDLHAKKHASYGDSWRKRGEMLSILPNIARKVDRLGVGDEFDSAADTLIDLMVYTAKYLNWMRGGEDTPEQVNILLLVALRGDVQPRVRGVGWLVADWDRYMDDVQADNLNAEQKMAIVADLLMRVAPMAVTIWAREQEQYQLFPADEYRGADVD